MQNRWVGALYDRIGNGYSATRRQDPRIAARILAALGDARSVVNVGAGTGSYEPTDREVLAVEPSSTMIAQRPPGSAPAVRASAEHLPLADASFDAAMAVNTMQHWTDVRAGVRELRRVARRRVVVFLRDGRAGNPFWLFEEYLPILDRTPKIAGIVAAIHDELPAVEMHAVPLPNDCADGVGAAYWARPERYLDPAVRANMSNFALAPPEVVAEGLARLRADLDSGAWDARHGALRTMAELDLGHRLLVAELG